MLAWAAAGVTAHLFAILKALPVAHLRVQGGQGEFAQPLGLGLAGSAQGEFGQEHRHLRLEDENDLAQFLQHA